jgi:hypothetical protein
MLASSCSLASREVMIPCNRSISLSAAEVEPVVVVVVVVVVDGELGEV